MDKNYLIKKWLDNDLTDQEQTAFDQMEDSPFLKEIIQEGKRFKGQNPYKVTSFESLDKQLQNKQQPSTNWMKVISRIAAIFIVGFGIYFLTNNDHLQTYETQLAQKEQVTLPDNSVVTMNELSRLDYDSKNWDNQRQLTLKGEAFFKVAKGKRFDVTTDFGTVSVLGTEFNVSARDSLFNVVCYEGLVQVIYKDKKIKLPAGKAYRIVNGLAEAYDIAVVEPEWLHNLKVFKDAKIGDVFTAIESHYKVRIITDGIDDSMRFTGAFELENLENALKATTETLKLTYEMEQEKVAVIKNAKK